MGNPDRTHSEGYDPATAPIGSAVIMSYDDSTASYIDCGAAAFDVGCSF